MSTYTAPLDDISFTLRHIADIDDLAQMPAWSDIGLEHARRPPG